MQKPVTRRKALAGVSIIGSISLSGCTDLLPSDGENEDTDRIPITDISSRERGFRIGPDGGGIDFEERVVVEGDHTPEGLAYRDGHFYTGQREGPATIREYTVEGERTDNEFMFSDVAINHTNTLDWVDEELLVSDSSTNTTYTLDWANKEVSNKIEHADPITGTFRAVIPTQTEELKLLYCQWQGPNAWLVDFEDAYKDGTTAGNIERKLRNGFWTDPQTMEWVDGYLYTTTHSWIIKSRLPFADQLHQGYPVTSYDIEWAFEFEEGNTLEQLMYNADDGEFYLVDRGGPATIYAGQETYEEHRNKSFNRWNTTQGAPDSDRALHVNDSGTVQLMFTEGHGEDKVGWIDVWYFDNGDDNNEVGVGIRTNTNENYALGTWGELEAYSTNYVWYDDEEWDDTGVGRTSNEWVKFGWEINQKKIDGYISRNLGNSWEHVFTVQGEDMTANHLWIRNADGSAQVGSWYVELRNVDEF